MLRAASRAIHPRIVRQSSGAQSTSKRAPIPRLCPSRYIYHEPIRWSSSNTRSTNLPSETPPKPADRSYSTAAAAPAFSDIDTSTIFPPLSQNATPYSIPVEPLEPLDSSQLLCFENWACTEEKYTDDSAAGILSDKDEVFGTFHACLATGSILRAQLMLEHITKKCIEEKDTTVLVDVHNAFLKGLLDHQKEDGGLRGLKLLFMWFENKMRSEYSIKGDATTFALLLKASFAIPDKVASRRYLTEYVKLWKYDNRTILDVLESTLLSNEEVLRIAQICNLRIGELSATFQETIREKDRSRLAPIFKIPEAEPTPVKGFGLAAVKSSLRSLVDLDHMPFRGHDTDLDEDMEFRIERQKLLEEHSFDSAQERWRKDYERMSERGVIKQNQEINTLLWQWHQALVPLINEEILRTQIAEDRVEAPRGMPAGFVDRCLYGPFLRLMKPEKIAAITMIELLQSHTMNGIGVGLKTARAVLQVGRELELEYLAQQVQKQKGEGVFGQMSRAELTEIFQDKPAFRQLIATSRREGDLGLKELPEWPLHAKVKLGALLISMLIHVAKIPVEATIPGSIEGSKSYEKIVQNLPAFNHAYEYLRGRKLGVIKLHPELIRRLGTDNVNLAAIGKSLPMVVNPLPWTDWDEGGYFYTRSQVVRIKESVEQKQYVKAAAQKGHLDQLFAGLDVLGQTAWKINRRVFDVVLEVWNQGEEFAEIPAARQDVDYPPEPEPSADPKVRWEWVQEMKRLHAARRSAHSARCDVNFKIEIARAFLFEKFYFPHNVDFRGRAYPISPNLNHIGNDLSRGLLMFAEAKEVGESGLRWMKVHLANLAGFDKANFTDRVKYTDEHMEDILDSARDPLAGKRWWLKSEDPWQLLASCFALYEASSCTEPTQYKCHIPVAQDGTCNGLQHYAALGGDVAGARQVNLEPSDKPQDVYSGVAELVKASVRLDQEEGRPEAIALEGLVTRKVVKQTVMTNVYGVTFIGARLQIENQLKHIESLNQKDVPRLSLYLTRKVFESIQEMFSGASAIQNWLVTCAKKISRSVAPDQLERLGNHPAGKEESSVHFMTSVIWTTPLRLPVVQPYRQMTSAAISTNLQTVYINDPRIINKVDSRKQMTAFPPNFIHSLDASHMLLSALNCKASGLTFASVHDSFWTHPSDVDEMNVILRKAFIALHEKELMQNLKAEFEERYKGFRTLAKVAANSRCGKEIKKARRTYAQEKFERCKMTAVEDLEWEIERWNLMQSSDPCDREKAERMVTPSVILEKHGGLEPNELLEDTGRLGLDEATSLGDRGEDEESMVDQGAILGPPEENDDGHEEGVPLDEDMVLADMEEDLRMLNPAIGEDADLREAAARKQKRSKARMKRGGDKKTISDDNGIIKKTPKPRPVHTQTLGVWVELTFPELPPKGRFDVRRLKESEYFFS